MHRENGSAPQPKTGLAKGRLALVHRYMVDAQQAEASGRDAAEEEAHAREPEPTAAAGEQGAREAADECAASRKESNVGLKGLSRKLAPNGKLPRPQPRRS